MSLRCCSRSAASFCLAAEFCGVKSVPGRKYVGRAPRHSTYSKQTTEKSSTRRALACLLSSFFIDVSLVDVLALNFNIEEPDGICLRADTGLAVIDLLLCVALAHSSCASVSAHLC